MRITSELGFLQPQGPMDITANNAANIGTVGFKAQLEQETQAFEPLELQANAAQYPQRPVGGQGAAAVATFYGKRFDFSQGPIMDTGNPLDLAITGEGFFQVLGANGEVFYTRAGNFRLDEARRLTDAAGRFLRLTDQQGQTLNPPPEVPADATAVTVKGDGAVIADSQGQEVVIGRIPLAVFTNPDGLRLKEGTLYQATPESGAAIEGTAGTGAGNDGNGKGFGAIRSGSLEQSNVDMITTMTRLIQAQQAYQFEDRIVKQNDDMWSEANSIRR